MIHLALSYRDTGMEEISSAYFPVFPSSWDAFPRGTREELNIICGTREGLNSMYKGSAWVPAFAGTQASDRKMCITFYLVPSLLCTTM